MLKKIVDDINQVEERFRDLYEKQADNKWHLKLDKDDAAELRGALENERNETKRLQAIVKKFENIDPEKARQAMASLDEMEEKRRRREGEFDTLKTQLIEKHKGELDAEKAKVTDRDKTIEKLVVDSAVIAALSAAKGKVKVLLPHVKQRVKVQYENGEAKAVVVDDKGSPRIADGQATPMTVEQYVAELKTDPDFAVNFESETRSGGGASATRRDSGGGGGGAATTVSRKDQKGLKAVKLADIATGKVTVTD